MPEPPIRKAILISLVNWAAANGLELPLWGDTADDCFKFMRPHHALFFFRLIILHMQGHYSTHFMQLRQVAIITFIGCNGAVHGSVCFSHAALTVQGSSPTHGVYVDPMSSFLVSLPPLAVCRALLLMCILVCVLSCKLHRHTWRARLLVSCFTLSNYVLPFVLGMRSAKRLSSSSQAMGMTCLTSPHGAKAMSPSHRLLRRWSRTTLLRRSSRLPLLRHVKQAIPRLLSAVIATGRGRWLRNYLRCMSDLLLDHG